MEIDGVNFLRVTSLDAYCTLKMKPGIITENDMHIRAHNDKGLEIHLVVTPHLRLVELTALRPQIHIGPRAVFKSFILRLTSWSGI